MRRLEGVVVLNVDFRSIPFNLDSVDMRWHAIFDLTGSPANEDTGCDDVSMRKLQVVTVGDNTRVGFLRNYIFCLQTRMPFRESVRK